MSDIPSLLPEWAPQDAVLLAWPHADTDWQPFLPLIEQVYCDIIFHLTRFQRVVLLCHNQAVRDAAYTRLGNADVNLTQVHLLTVAYNDTWLRDSGPITVEIQSGVQTDDFRFNGWGGKFDASQDDRICQALARDSLFKARYQRYDLILEGGSIDCDGEGTMLTTRQCLLSKTRNPKMTEADYEHFFAEAFGTKRVHWLEHGELLGDDTDGHVDMLARFCTPTTIAYTSCERPDDPHFTPLEALATELQSLRTAHGESYQLVPLPIPKPIHNQQGRRLPASYANFLIINDAVLVPLYQDDNDPRVMERLAACFSGREIIGINARPIIEQYGSLHCLTMQLPHGVLAW